MLWNQARKYLCMKDRKLSRIIRKYDGKLESRNNPFYSLCKSIVGQQVSVASADAVWNRLLSKCKKITPENINNLKINDLKDCGFSRQKIIYITELSKNFINKKFNINKLKKMRDDEAIDYLSLNKGIGRWSSEMFLLFNQNRLNIFPIQDIGFLRAISNTYKFNYPPNDKQLALLKKRWSPYCSVATWYMWRTVDPEIVQY